jgi:hypothetical protein
VVEAKGGSVCVCVRQFHPLSLVLCFDDDAKGVGKRRIKSRHLLAFSSRIILLGKHWLLLGCGRKEPCGFGFTHVSVGGVQKSA